MGRVRPRRFAGLPAAAGFAWCAGASLALFGGPWPGGTALLALAAVAALGCVLRGWPRSACLLGGFVLTGAAAQQQVELRWPGALDGQRVLVEGRVRGIPDDDGAQRRFDLEGAIVAPATLARPIRVRAIARGGSGAEGGGGAVGGGGDGSGGGGDGSSSSGDGGSGSSTSNGSSTSSRSSSPVPRAGERWRLLLRLEAPRAPLNPGGADAERFLFRERIDALATVVPSRLATRLAAAGPGLDGLREAIGTRIRERVADRDAAALIAGLAIGATADISREQWRVFGATGTVHLVAISGLHVTMFAWLAARFARLIWRRLRLGCCCDREPFAASCGLLAATGYALLAGFGVPARRTLLMLLVWWAARLAGRRVGGLEVIGGALLVVLLFDPLAPLDAGFWLSFAAIAVLVGSERLQRAPVHAAASAAGSASPAWPASFVPSASPASPASSASSASPTSPVLPASPVSSASPATAAAVQSPGANGPSSVVLRPTAAPLCRSRHAVAVIVTFVAVGLGRAVAALRELNATQWRLTLALAPATLMLFGSVPLAGLVANLAAIPLYSLLLVPSILAALAVLPLSESLAGAGWQAAAQLYLFTWPLFEAAAALPGSTWQREPAAAWLLVALLALPLCALPGPWVLRATALAALLPLFGAPLPPPERGAFQAWLLDTGDGTALLVMTQSHTLLYDTGDVYGSDGGRAARAVLPALRAAGRDRLDLLVQSRVSAFRVAGVATLLDGVPVRELRSGGRWVAAPRPRVSCTSESGWLWDDVELRLFPAGALRPGAEEAPSCVLRVAAARGRGAALLVPAQVDAAESRWLAAEGRAGRLRAEAVVAPRRGSPAAVVPGFAAAVAAREVLVASRELPTPRRAAVARAWGLDPQAVRSTAREGALVVSATPAGGLQVRRWLDGQPRRVWRVPRD